MADYDEQDAATRQLLFISEMAKSLALDPDQIRLEFGQKLLSRSAAITTEFENHVVDSVKEHVIRVKKLNKVIRLEQRLSDAEKSKLLLLWTPPYNLKFSSNASDLGAHMYYRSLNEIATFRCYDLLCGSESTPLNRDVLIKEVGASVPKIVKYCRKSVHACTPNLTMDDTIRLANTARTLESIMSDSLQSKTKRDLAKRMMNDAKYRCYRKSEHCTVTSKYVMFAHSSYDCDLTTIANIMDAAEAVRGMGFIHYSPHILSNIVEGSEYGLNWKLECQTFAEPIRKQGKFLGTQTGHYNNMITTNRKWLQRKNPNSIFGLRKKKFTIKFWFDNDYQNAYVHDLDMYLGLIRKSVCTSNKNVTYMIQRREEIGGLLFFEIIRPLHNIPPTQISRMIPFSDPGNTIIHYYRLQNDPDKYHYHELIPERLVCPRKFFERLYYYLFCLPEGRFTIQNAMTMASTMASRTIVNGSFVSQPFDMPLDLIDKVAHATYFIVYCRRYDLMQTFKTLKEFEDIRRHPSLYNRLCILMHRVRNFVIGTPVKQLKTETEFENIIDNGTNTLLNEVATQHSLNIVQWMLKLFRIRKRYVVDFFPVTRVVSIDEDIAAVVAMETSLPTMASPEEYEDLEEAIRERLHISHVDTEVCTIVEEPCGSKVYELPNAYTSQCLLLCFCNSYNVTLSDLQNTLLHSKFFERLFPTSKISFRNSILGKVSDLSLFELIACEYRVNICVHTEDKHIKYDVRSMVTYHYSIKDNHCCELRERISVQPYEFIPTRTTQPVITNVLSEAYTRPKEEKFKLYPVIVDSHFPYICRSALKLHELDCNYGVISYGNVFELSAAPGSWIQYCHLNHSQTKLYYTYYIDGLDYKYDHEDIVNLCDNTTGDIREMSFFETLTHDVEKVGGMNTVLSDAMILMDGEDAVDVAAFSQYQEMFFTNLKEWLLDHGNVVFKSFADVPLSKSVENVLGHFENVWFTKPTFSAPLSTEYYIVGKNFLPEADVVTDNLLYTTIPDQVMNKVLIKASLFMKNKYPPQRKYTLPAINPKTGNRTVDVSEPEFDEDEPEPTPFADTDSFEDRFVKVWNRLEFHDVSESKLVVCTEDSSLPSDFDVDIRFYDSPLIESGQSCQPTGYIIYESTRIRIDFSTIGFADMISNLHAVSYKMNTFKLRVRFDLVGVDDNHIVEKIQSHIKERFSRHEVYVRTNYVNCTAPIHVYEKSIIEFVTYTKSVKAANLSSYRYHYNSLSANEFVLTHTIKKNVGVDTQNVSILKGTDYKYRHDKVQDNYTHAFCGVCDKFIPFSECRPDRWYFVGDFTHRMFDDVLVDRVLAIDLTKLADVQFVLVQGVAGHGKTQEIVTNHKPSLKNLKGDLLVTPTSAGKLVLMERTVKVHKLDPNILDTSSYRTVTSFLMHTEAPKTYSTLYFDEAIMVHVAVVLATAYYSGARTVYMYGDTAQIPAHSRLGGFDFQFHAPQKLFTAQQIRNKSYRIPADVAAALDDTYRECHSSFNQNIGIVTTSVNLRSLNVVAINDVSEMKNHFNDNVTYLTFTHTTANDLNKLDKNFKASTIAAFQGSENSEIAIVRTSVSEADNIYNNVNLCVTALTRHTRKLTYYTACHKGDFMKKAIDYANNLTDHRIKSFSTSLSVGSIHGPDYVIMSEKPSISRFFKSRSRYTHSFTVLDHSSICTEKAFAIAASTVKNDIFVHKSIFKKFSMNELLKWVKKLAPHVKEIFVRVQNEPFENNSQILELVEEYKCNNVIPTSVVDQLVPVSEPLHEPEVVMMSCIELKPNLEMLRVFMSHLYPHQMYVNTDLDAYFVHHSDIDYTLNDVSFSLLWDRPAQHKYDTLTPFLSTPAPALRDVTMREIILGLQKRNLNPPQLIENASAEDVSCHLLQNFGKMMIPHYTDIIKDMEPIMPTTQSIITWLERQDRSVLKNIIHDIPLCLADLSNCALSLKRNPKVRISPTAIDVYDSVQTITCHPKFVNAFFCSVVEMAQDRLLKLMKPYFKIFTKKTSEDFGKDCYKAYSNFGKVFMFSGDDSLLINGNSMKEMDMSKFDKSQLIFALEFLTKLFMRLGVPKYIAQLYYEMMYFRVCRDPMNKVTVALTPQMESGSAATYFGNTCFCAAVVLSCLDLDDYRYTPKFEKFSLMFNLEVKEFNYANPYFCSKFVMIDDFGIRFLPDPIKILIKLGRRDLKNFTHMKEFQTSLKDLVSQYRCVMDVAVVSAAIRERYGFPYDCSVLIQNLISLIKDDKLFSMLFYSNPGDLLDHKANKFSED